MDSCGTYAVVVDGESTELNFSHDGKPTLLPRTTQREDDACVRGRKKETEFISLHTAQSALTKDLPICSAVQCGGGGGVCDIATVCSAYTQEKPSVLLMSPRAGLVMIWGAHYKCVTCTQHPPSLYIANGGRIISLCNNKHARTFQVPLRA